MGAAAFLALVFAALVLWLRYDALPHADRHRDAIVASMEKATGMAVAIGSVHGSWQGLRPVLALDNLRLADRRGRAAFELERAEVSVSWWPLLLGKLHFHDVQLYRPQLELRRGADGLIYLADKPLNGGGGSDDTAFTDWLLSQPRLRIHDAVLVWRDDFLGSPELRLTSVEFAVDKHLGRHRAALTALPPPELAGRIDLRVDVAIARYEGRWQASGELFADTRDTDLGRLRNHIPVPETLRSGVGSVRVWAQVGPDGVDEVVADVSLRDGRAQLAADTLPLEVASLSGRVVYRTEPTGFTFGTERLRFALVGGLAAEPGRFSLTRRVAHGEEARAELRADNIDLKIAAALVDYFPVPRDVKNQVTRFAPRGRIRDALVAWSAGTARRYAVKGRFEDLSINAVDTLPGIDGFDGVIDGTEAGGTLMLDTRQATFEAKHLFRGPIAFDTLQARARWKPLGRAIEVTVEDARFANADVEGSLAGTWRSLPDGAHPLPGTIALKGQFSRARLGSLAAYVPERLAITRDWLERSVQSGQSPRVAFELRGDLYEFPFGGESKGHFLMEGDLKGAQLRYHPDWPPVDDIDGSFRLENRSIEVRATSAKIFASRVSATSAVISDFAVKPVLVTVQGEVDTTGADTTRFLRESPLANGPGAFTRVIAVEGPGRLKLRLDYPLGVPAQLKIAGEYTFAGGSATAARTIAMRDLKGKLAFSERDVRATDIAGTIFGQPAMLGMVTQAGEVVTSIAGRVEAPSLAPWVPPAFLARLAGSTEWKARVASSRNGTEVTLESALQGLGSTLPEPLAKAAADSRPLTIAVSRLGYPDEVARVAFDGGVFGRVHRLGANNAERWQAAFRFGSSVASEPRQDGLWLYGKLDAVDVDAWQAVFAANPASAPPPEAPAASPAGGAFELRGLDLMLARAHFLGRDFLDLAANLERRDGRWAGHLESPLVAGQVSWDPKGRGQLVAKLERLAIPEATAVPASLSAGQHDDLPAIDVTSDRFDFRGRALGRLELKADPVDDEWRIHQLDITSKHTTLKSSGAWRRTATGSITTLAMSVDIANMNGLFSAFGFGDYMKRGAGHLEASLAWPGLPSEFGVANLSGTMKVDAKAGQFAKMDPGAGKLLGLLSLQSLPRRASLDFRDVFSEGFAFEKIQGDVKIARGVLLTDDFEISGPAAFVNLAGEVSLPQETQALTVRVVPEVSESMALAATVLGTPVLGLSTLLVSKLLKNPIGKAVAYEYQVTGSWDNPVITKSSAARPS